MVAPVCESFYYRHQIGLRQEGKRGSLKLVMLPFYLGVECPPFDVLRVYKFGMKPQWCVIWKETDVKRRLRCLIRYSKASLLRHGPRPGQHLRVRIEQSVRLAGIYASSSVQTFSPFLNTLPCVSQILVLYVYSGTNMVNSHSHLSNKVDGNKFDFWITRKIS